MAKGEGSLAKQELKFLPASDMHQFALHFIDQRTRQSLTSSGQTRIILSPGGEEKNWCILSLMCIFQHEFYDWRAFCIPWNTAHSRKWMYIVLIESRRSSCLNTLSSVDWLKGNSFVTHSRCQNVSTDELTAKDHRSLFPENKWNPLPVSLAFLPSTCLPKDFFLQSFFF